MSDRLEEPLFVRNNGSAITRLQKYPGSLLDKFERVSGVSTFKLTNLRKGSEAKIQNSSQLVKHVPDLNYHSAPTGSKYYYNMGSARR